MAALTYDRKLINAYINGDDLGKHTEAELEDNFSFMQDVLMLSNDKNMFNYASDTLKNNIDFVVRTIKLFKKDEDFVTKLYIDFIKNHPRQKEIFVIYLYNMFRGYNSSFAKHIEEKSNIVYDKLNVYDSFDEFKNHCNNNIKLVFVARRLVCNLFYKNKDYTLAGIIHKNLTAEEAKTINPTAFVMDYINKYDSTLKDFIDMDINMISDVFVDVKIELRNWGLYEKKLNEIRVQKALMLVYEHIIAGNKDASMQDLLSCIVYNLDLKNAFQTYDKHNNIKGLKYEDYKDNYKTVDKNRFTGAYDDLEEEVAKVFKKDYLGERKK